jgi:hypothetical protein
VLSFLDHAPCLRRALGDGDKGGIAALWRVGSSARRYFGSEPFGKQTEHALTAAADTALRMAGWDDAKIATAVTHRGGSWVRRCRRALPPRTPSCLSGSPSGSLPKILSLKCAPKSYVFFKNCP